MPHVGVPPRLRMVARHRAAWADHFRLLAAVRVDAEVGLQLHMLLAMHWSAIVAVMPLWSGAPTSLMLLDR